MKTVTLLVRLVRLLLSMIWYIYNRLYPIVERLWRTLGLLWRYMRTMFRPILGYAFLPIRWLKDRGSQGAPEINSEDKPTERVWSGGVEESRCEGQPEAAPGKWAADTNPEFTPELEEADETVGEDDEFASEEYRVERTDDLYCGYDSTWETEGNLIHIFKRTRKPAGSTHYKFSRFENAARDMQEYRHDYPSLQRWVKPGSGDMPNLKFYLGLTPSVPDGVYIHDFHNEWYRQYDTLEFVHTYIQWLFPLQEAGMNHEASTLTKEEIEEFLQNSTAKANLLKSYELMLDFYGIELCDENTGEVRRAPNWRDRFHNLECHSHNNLRITRILKCQGTLGYPHYQAPLVRFFLEQTLVHGELPSVKESVLNYFVFAVLDKSERRSLIKYAYLNYDRKDEFVWCPKKIQMIWSGQSGSELQQEMKGNRDAY